MASTVCPLRLIDVLWDRTGICAGGMTDLFLVKLQLISKLSPCLEFFLDDIVQFLRIFSDLLRQIPVLQDLLLSMEHMLFQETD